MALHMPYNKKELVETVQTKALKCGAFRGSVVWMVYWYKNSKPANFHKMHYSE